MVYSAVYCRRRSCCPNSSTNAFIPVASHFVLSSAVVDGDGHKFSELLPMLPIVNVYLASHDREAFNQSKKKFGSQSPPSPHGQIPSNIFRGHKS